MTYSAKLQRQIQVPVDQLNRFDEAELDAAIAALPGYPDTRPETIRELAAHGDLNAKLILEEAAKGNQIAIDWI